MANKINTILFDMDGVLIEAKEWHFEALNRALQLFGFEISRYEHLQTFDGLPTKRKLEMISEIYDLPIKLHTIINNLKQKFTEQLVFEKCKPLFHHEYALARLKKEGYQIGVCSNSMKKTILLMMEKSNLFEYLDLIVSNEDVIYSKPNPEIYIKAMNYFNVSPSECLVLEDNKNGIIAATESGSNVMVIGEVTDVTYFNILKRINEIEVER